MAFKEENNGVFLVLGLYLLACVGCILLFQKYNSNSNI